MGSVELLEYLKEKGYNLDVRVPPELFEDAREDFEETGRTVVTEMYPEASSYRDDRKRSSIHLTDYRGVERENMKSDVIVAHLEHFNPEHHPLLHTMVDSVLWFVRNRVLRRNKL